MIFRTAGAEQLDDFRITLAGTADAVHLEVSGTTEPFHIPFSRGDIERALDDDTPNRLSTDPLMSVGSTLFNLLSGKVARQLWEKTSEAESQNRGLRIRIFSSLERIQHLPWELMFDPSRGDFMSLSGRMALVRSRAEGYSEDSLSALTKLRILAVEADVSGLMRCDEDLRVLDRLVADNPGRIEVVKLERATPIALREKLRQGPYDVFHFAGMGEVLPKPTKRGGLRQALRLLGSNYVDPLFDAHELGTLLQSAGVRLAVLNACHTDWVARSLARYVPAAIGLRESLKVEVCIAFCQSLYSGLSSALPIDRAVTAARQGADREVPGTGQWCKLILYLQRPDGAFLLDAEAPQLTMPVAAARPPEQDRSKATLAGLLEVYERNLSAIERNSATTTVSKPETEGLKRKIEDLKRQLSQPV